MFTIQQWISHEVEIKSPPEKWSILFLDMHSYLPFVLITYPEQISQNVDKFPFLILQKHQQNGLKTNQTKGVWLKKCNDQDAATR